MAVDYSDDDISLLGDGQLIDVLTYPQYQTDPNCSCHPLLKEPELKVLNNLEFHVWDETKTVRLASNYNVPLSQYSWMQTNPLPHLQLDIDRNLRDLGITEGRFVVQYFLFRPILNFVIKEISPSRTEMRVKPVNTNQASADMTGYRALLTYRRVCSDGTRNELVANFGDYQHYAITNWITDGEASGQNVPTCDNVFRFSQDIDFANLDENGDPDPWSSFILKTYEPLPPQITVKKQFSLQLQFVEKIEKKVILYPFPDIEQCRVLRIPDWSTVDHFTNDPSGITNSNWNSVLGNNVSGSVSNRLVNELLSGSNSVDLNVDYRNFENFIHFGSAENRINNFYKKIQDIESNNASISSLTNGVDPAYSAITESAEFKANILKFENARENVIGGFDNFEKYLYYGSSSYVTNSFGDFLDMSWPKSNNIKPYTLYSYSSSAVQDWLGSVPTKTGIIYSASLYDFSNRNELVKTIPQFIRDDAENDKFEDFVKLVGQHFDEQWLYTKKLTMINDRKESIEEGMSKDLILYVLQQFGWNPLNGQSFESLWKWAFGYDEFGVYQTLDSFSNPSSSINYVVTESMSSKDINREIWKRILNNMPHLVKTKGAAKGMRGILNCYGVPKSALNIVQYGIQGI